MSDSAIVIIDYTNWRGIRTERRILPTGIVFESNEFHPKTQWLIKAIDIKKGELRMFALANIHSWKPEQK